MGDLTQNKIPYVKRIDKETFFRNIGKYNKTIYEGNPYFSLSKNDTILMIRTEYIIGNKTIYLEGRFETQSKRDISHFYRRTLAILVITLLVAFIYISLTGLYIVGSPLKRINLKINEMKNGTFDNFVVNKGNDEFTDLSIALNELSREIKSANLKIKNENNEKVEYLKQLRHAHRLTTAGVLTSGIAHELGTPLNVILGHSSLIKSNTKDKSIIESSKVISNQVKKMTALIDSLLVFCNKKSIEKSPQDLGEVIESSMGASTNSCTSSCLFYLT
jgi:signal transduction histidine kinase